MTRILTAALEAARRRAAAPRPDVDPADVDPDAERQAVIDHLLGQHRRATGAPPRS